MAFLHKTPNIFSCLLCQYSLARILFQLIVAIALNAKKQAVADIANMMITAQLNLASNPCTTEVTPSNSMTNSVFKTVPPCSFLLGAIDHGN